ncbi:hypothetical protein LWI29_033809 [Acer saccharum]|uniref:Uncharacterized protein n=1 Tax=Acer saccharum TaxID=4024 RepID=A0AA39T2I7_ACESA|nr:hypothetical protein LWI29_033809 [Acer saccharum]
MKISPPSATTTATVSTATTTTTKITAICSQEGFNFCYCCYLGVTDSNSVSAEIRHTWSWGRESSSFKSGRIPVR